MSTLEVCLLCQGPADRQDFLDLVSVRQCQSPEECGAKLVVFVVPGDNDEREVKIMGQLLPLGLGTGEVADD